MATYCKINNPNLWNEHSSFFTISPNDYLYGDKDFELDWVNPKNNERVHKIISREFIIKNATYCNAREYNKNVMRKDQASLAFRIPVILLLKY